MVGGRSPVASSVPGEYWPTFPSKQAFHGILSFAVVYHKFLGNSWKSYEFNFKNMKDAGTDFDIDQIMLKYKTVGEMDMGCFFSGWSHTLMTYYTSFIHIWMVYYTSLIIYQWFTIRGLSNNFPDNIFFALHGNTDVGITCLLFSYIGLVYVYEISI